MMDDTIVKNISKKTLDSLLEKLNKKFISELPFPPEELLKYAKRRVSPEISKNISFELGNKMLDTRMSDEEYLLAFFQAVHTSFNNKKPSDNPTASILISQTGAGKTNLRNVMLENIDSVIINSDLYKKYNPKYEEIMIEDPTNLGALTAIDSYDHSVDIKTLAMDKKYNLLFECAPSEHSLIGVDINELNESNYNTQFHVLAVGDLISALSIHYRYEMEMNNPNRKNEIKLTDLGRHDASYKGVERVLLTLDSSKVLIYRRGLPEENYVPQLLQIPEPDSNGVLPIHELVEILNKQRELSNRQYVYGFSNNTFKIDFHKIKESMINRNAPEKQFEQLQKIEDRYNLYLLKTKKEEEL